MGDPGIVTDEDIKAMIERQGIAPIGEGDCVFLYTGHGDIWHPSRWDTFDAETQLSKRAIELNNGRAAQLGILGLMVHEKLGEIDMAVELPIIGTLA